MDRNEGAQPVAKALFLDAWARLRTLAANEQEITQIICAIARGEVAGCQGYSKPGRVVRSGQCPAKGEDKADHWL